MHELDAEPAGFLRRNIGVGLQSLIRLSQVNEMVEACLDRMPVSAIHLRADAGHRSLGAQRTNLAADWGKILY